jgi:HTH-type transcriptional regulator/antitoxin HigA
MSHIKLIKSAHDHESALMRLMSLMDLDPQPGSAESDEIDVLALLIEKYEEEHFPINKPDPIEAIKFRMEQQGLKNRDLIPFIGSAPKVSEILNGTRSLSLNMIRKLSSGLDISAEVLIQLPEQKHAIQKEVDWQAFPIAEMRKRGYFDGFNGSLQELKEYAAETLSDFIGSVKSGFNLQPALLRASSHLRTNDKETDPYALWAWQIRVLQKAAEQNLPYQYRANTVNLKWMQNISKLSWLESGPLLAIEFLNKSGIHVIIEPHLPKTYLDGAVCMSIDGNPIIALSLRYNRLDSFWFSLMHEMAHIALHLDGNESWYLDDLDAQGADEIEQQADAMAREALIPESIWSGSNVSSAEAVRELAKELQISPCIVAGRARFESGDHKKFGSLFRDKINDYLPC